MVVIEIVVGIGLGYVPGIDNFAHLGGMAMGMLLSIWLCALAGWRDMLTLV